MKKFTLYMLTALTAMVIMTSAKAPKRGSMPKGIDLEKVRAEVNDPRSEFFYDSLMAAFERVDTTMTLEDYRYLYFGTMFQEDYNPYRRNAYADIINPLTHKASHTRAERDTLMKYTQLALLDTPFDLAQINFLIYALRSKQKYNEADIWQYRLNHLLQAIVSTGTGADTTSAWYVIYPRDEATIVNIGKNVQSLRPTFIEPYYDCIEVTDEHGKTQDFYFNICPVLDEYYLKYPED
ncbi:MAG: DUF4919 domain-containing protein [Muribaculaceae bacterium]|nr:DUF4919 domain-containing protein [Muribaculaceae bacterium]